MKRGSVSRLIATLRRLDERGAIAPTLVLLVSLSPLAYVAAGWLARLALASSMALVGT